MRKLTTLILILALSGCAAGHLSSNGPTPKVGHEYAWQGFRAAYAGQPIPNLEEVRSIAKQQQPANLIALARAALWHAGKISNVEFDRHWLVKRAPDETSSPLYHGTWGISAICSVDTPQARIACRGSLAWFALTSAEWLRCEVEDHKGVRGNRSRTTSVHGWGGAQFAGAGNRQLWNPGVCKPFHDRMPPAWRWAQGHPVNYRGWGDTTTGFPAQVLRDSIRNYGITLPRDDTGLLEVLDQLPTQPRQRFDVIQWQNGDMLTVMDRSQMQTRGPVCATTVTAKTKTLRLTSASVPVEVGQWQSCWGKIDDAENPAMLRVRVGSDQRRITWEVPRAGIVSWYGWDERGAGPVGEAPPPPVDPEDPPPPDPGPPPGQGLPNLDTVPALLAWDALIKKLEATHPKRGTAARTANELMRRLLEEEDYALILRAHKTLGRLLETIDRASLHARIESLSERVGELRYECDPDLFGEAVELRESVDSLLERAE